MDYSIVIPVFNKAELTQQCLRTLRPTLEGAGEGEVIVIDNASSDSTPQILREFEWIRTVRNEQNLGFAGANNQGARMARGEYLVMLNNDTQGHPGWLAAMMRAARKPGTGAVGARLLYPDNTIQHAGVVIAQRPFGKAGFNPYHAYQRRAGTLPEALIPRDYQILTAACLVTPLELFLESGGLDEGFWNGYEDVDYCLRLCARGLRLQYEPTAVLTHFESQSGVQRFRKVWWNVLRLSERWNGRVRYDENARSIERGLIVRQTRLGRGFMVPDYLEVPATTVVIHGPVPQDRETFLRSLRANNAPIERIEFVDAASAVPFVRDEMERRGDRFLALVDSAADLRRGWLDELVRQIQFAPTAGAATYAPEIPLGEDVASYTADARCTLLHLRKYPQHERLGNFPTLNGAVADFLIRGIASRAGVRGAGFALGALPAPAPDPRFEELHGTAPVFALAESTDAIERAMRSTPGRRVGLVSIVMLSWNAPQFTKLALESIRTYTQGDYEIIIVDNGSGPETVEWLRTLTGVRIIYNPSNRGYAGGNNQAIAAAAGEYVVLLNNDVVVTEGWLDGLLHAFDRIPGLGVSAPRSNKIAGDQVIVDATYADMTQMHEYAGRRRERYRDQGYSTDRAIGLCLCIDRRVIEEIGGIDERFGVGNFEDDDFCLRVRAAGYRIFVCDDVFIHHFGSQTFAANKVDWTATMDKNWKAFAAKWELPEKKENGGYTPAPAIRRGFIRDRHYVPLPSCATEATAARDYGRIFTAVVRDERDWNEVGSFARRYMRAFTSEQPVLLAIAAFGEPSAGAIGARLERLAGREGIASDAVADVEVSDEVDEASWRDALAAERCVDVSGIASKSPSALRRYLEEGGG